MENVKRIVIGLRISSDRYHLINEDVDFSANTEIEASGEATVFVVFRVSFANSVMRAVCCSSSGCSGACCKNVLSLYQCVSLDSC